MLDHAFYPRTFGMLVCGSRHGRTEPEFGVCFGVLVKETDSENLVGMGLQTSLFDLENLVGTGFHTSLFALKSDIVHFV